MDQAQQWALIVGFFLPPLIAVVQKEPWPDMVRAAVMFFCCMIASAGTVYFTTGFASGDYVSSLLIVLVTTISTYHGLWKPSGVTSSIEKAIAP